MNIRTQLKSMIIFLLKASAKGHFGSKFSIYLNVLAMPGGGGGGVDAKGRYGSTNCIGVCSTIDYRATYVYGIGNKHALLIVLHWAALKRSSEYIALAKIN